MAQTGRVQLLCKNGHLSIKTKIYHNRDNIAENGRETGNLLEDYGLCECAEHYTYTQRTNEYVKTACQGEFIWSNTIDDSNETSYGIIPDLEMEVFLSARGKPCVCTCGHRHFVGGKVFRIPTDEETKVLRKWWDSVQGIYRPLNEY